MAGSRPASPPGFMARIRRGSRVPARCVRSIAADTASSATRASRLSTRPASVSATARLVRSNRVTPSLRSSCRTALDSAGCAMPSRAAARPKCSSSATARKYASSRVSSRSIPPGYRSRPGRSGVSLSYYTRMERGDLRGVSESVLHSVARALQLDGAETTHLLDLGQNAIGPVRRTPVKRESRLALSVLHLIDTMSDVPVIAGNRLGETIASNKLGRALFPHLFPDDGPPLNQVMYT